jgi:hypothetical protein
VQFTTSRGTTVAKVTTWRQPCNRNRNASWLAQHRSVNKIVTKCIVLCWFSWSPLAPTYPLSMLAAFFILFYYFPWLSSSTLKIAGACASEASIDFQRLHGVISHKRQLFITATMRTSNTTSSRYGNSLMRPLSTCTEGSLRNLIVWRTGDTMLPVNLRGQVLKWLSSLKVRAVQAFLLWGVNDSLGPTSRWCTSTLVLMYTASQTELQMATSAVVGDLLLGPDSIWLCLFALIIQPTLQICLISLWTRYIYVEYPAKTCCPISPVSWMPGRQCCSGMMPWCPCHFCIIPVHVYTNTTSSKALLEQFIIIHH